MTRTIKAKDILPGMTIRWSQGDISYQCTLVSVEHINDDQDAWGKTQQGKIVLIGGDEDVLVIKEPPQPDEPTGFGAKVRVLEGQFVRLDEPGFRFRLWYEMGTGRRLTWDELREMGPVTVVPDQGWEPPASSESAPEVPERIEEWPEDDRALRPYPWRDSLGGRVALRFHR